MINILFSLLSIAAVKTVFIWIFAPKNQKDTHGARALHIPVIVTARRKTRDGRGIKSSSGFGLEASDRLVARKRVSPAFGASALERFLEGQ